MSKLTQNTGACSEKVEEGEEPNPDKVCCGGEAGNLEVMASHPVL